MLLVKYKNQVAALVVKGWPMNRFSRIIPLILLLVLGLLVGGCQTSGRTGQSGLAHVMRVIDGDTIVVNLDGRNYKVRFIGIDTPERGRPYYWEATQKTREMVLGKDVRLVKDVSETDKYGRLLRYVYVDDKFVNAELVKQGYALQFTLPPDVKYADLFRKLAAEAREKGVGLRSSNTAGLPSNSNNAGKQDIKFIGNANSQVFHYANCPYAKKIAPDNIVNFPSSEDAKSQGYRPCKTCNPK